MVINDEAVMLLNDDVMIMSMMMTIDEAMTVDMVTGHQQVVGSVEQQIAFNWKRVQDTNTQNLSHDDTHKLGRDKHLITYQPSKMTSHSFESF